MIAVGAVAVRAGSLRDGMRERGQSASRRAGQVATYADSAPAVQLATVEYKEA